MPRVAQATILPVIVFALSRPVRAQRHERDVIEQVAKAAAGIFERAKAKPSSDSATVLREFVEQGANFLISDKKTSDRDLSVLVELIRRFVAEMVKHGVLQGETRPGDWVSSSFAAGQRSLCPLDRFC